MKGQSAIEYMMIISITLVIMIPLLYLVNSYMYQSRDEFKIRSLEDGVDSLAEIVDMVYFQGYPAKMTTKLYVPENVLSSQIDENLLTMKIRISSGTIDIPVSTQANMTGNLPTEPGTYTIIVVAQEDGLVNVSY